MYTPRLRFGSSHVGQIEARDRCAKPLEPDVEIAVLRNGDLDLVVGNADVALALWAERYDDGLAVDRHGVGHGKDGVHLLRCDDLHAHHDNGRLGLYGFGVQFGNLGRSLVASGRANACIP